MKDYVDARREFWERVFADAYVRAEFTTGCFGPEVIADQALDEWDARYKLGPNGTCVPRDQEAGTYNATDAGAI